MICKNIKILYLQPAKTATTSISNVLLKEELNKTIPEKNDGDTRRGVNDFVHWVHQPWSYYVDTPNINDYIHLHQL